MADSFVASGGENMAGQAPLPGQTEPQVPVDASVIINQMAEAIRQLEARLNALGTQAGGAVNQLQGAVQHTHEVALSRPANVKIPQPQRFKGNREGPKVLEWAHQATTYLKAAGLDATVAGVWHISNFLDADAAIWWRVKCEEIEKGKAQMPANWTSFKEQLVNQFQLFNYVTDVRDQYTSLRQTKTVSAYIAKFRSLVVELPGEPEEVKIYQFLKGLKPEIQARTRTHKSGTLMEAMDIADEADRAQQHAYLGVHGDFKEAQSSYLPALSQPVPMEIGAVPVARTGMPAKVVIRTPLELKKLREEHRCFNCREQGQSLEECPNA